MRRADDVTLGAWTPIPSQSIIIPEPISHSSRRPRHHHYHLTCPSLLFERGTVWSRMWSAGITDTYASKLWRSGLWLGMLIDVCLSWKSADLRRTNDSRRAKPWSQKTCLAVLGVPDVECSGLELLHEPQLTHLTSRCQAHASPHSDASSLLEHEAIVATAG